MSGISSPVTGSNSGCSGTSIPGSVDYAHIVAKNKVDLDDAITGPTTIAIKFLVPDPAGTIAGGLSTTATGFEFSDGTNTATLTTTLPVVGEDVVVAIDLGDDTMRIRQIPSVDKNEIADSNDITTSNWTTVGTGTTRLSAHVLSMAAVNPSRVTSNTTAYVALTTGQTFRLSARVKNLATANNRIVFGVVASSSPYEETQIGPYTKEVDTLVVAELTALRNCSVFVYFGNSASSPGTVELYDIRGEIKSGRSNGLVSFGDSICNASIETGSFADNLASYTARYALALGIPYQNRGVSGESLTQIKARIASQIGTPGTVFLEGGVNDIFLASSDPNITMQAKMTSMIAAVITAGGVPVCFEIPLCGTFGSKSAWADTYNTWLNTYCAAQTPPIQVVPLYSILTDSEGDQISEYYTADFTHPNNLGHTAIAEWMVNNLYYVGDTLDNDGAFALFDGTIPAWES